MGEGYDPLPPESYSSSAVNEIYIFSKLLDPLQNCVIFKATRLPCTFKISIIYKNFLPYHKYIQFLGVSTIKLPFWCPSGARVSKLYRPGKQRLLYSCCIDCWGAWRASLARSLQHGFEFTLPSFMLSRTCMAQCLYN